MTNQPKEYGNKRDYPKIDISANGRYICSTTWSKTCRQAAAIFRNEMLIRTSGLNILDRDKWGLTGYEIITAKFAAKK